MSDTVWISHALGNPARDKPIVSNIYLEGAHESMDINFSNLQGEVLPEHLIPTYAVWNKSAGAKRTTPPFVFGDLPFFSKEFVEIVSHFNLGGIRFFEVPVFRSKDQEDTYASLYFANLANVQTRMLPSKSTKLSPMGPPQMPIWHAETPAHESQVAVSQLNASGTDMWIGRHLYKAFFVSDRLKRAFDEHGLSGGLDLVECRLVPDDPNQFDFSAELVKQKQAERARLERLSSK